MKDFDMNIIWLDDPRAQQTSLVGGKAASLSRFRTHRVPQGFCVVTHLPVGVQERKRPPRMLLAPELQGDLVRAYEELSTRCGMSDVPVAVRSSAGDEDGRRFSFAGQYETLLNVRGVDAVAEAVGRCLASASSLRAHHYRTRHGLPSERVQFSVLVQHMVAADASAVVFSANPVTGARDEIVINANWGLGASIVSGLITPDAFHVDKQSGRTVSRHIALKERMTTPAAQGTHHVAVPAARRDKPSLSNVQVLEVARLAADLEAMTGYPVDVECAYQAGTLFLLQCRPITTLT